jgi:hypothetical protein
MQNPQVNIVAQNNKLIKDKGKLVPVILTEHHAMKAYWDDKFNAFMKTLNCGEVGI